MYRYIHLTETEVETLSEGYKNHPKHHFRQRCKALLLSDCGKTCMELAALFNVRSRTIYTWMDRWEQKGIVGLMIQTGRGRPPLLKVTDAQIISVVKKNTEICS